MIRGKNAQRVVLSRGVFWGVAPEVSGPKLSPFGSVAAVPAYGVWDMIAAFVC